MQHEHKRVLLSALILLAIALGLTDTLRIQSDQQSTLPSSFSFRRQPLATLFLLGALGVWRRSRLGYAASAVLSGIFLILEGTQVLGALGAVTILNEFLSAITAVPVLVAVVVYSVLGLRRVWGKAPYATPAHLIPASSFVILLILGFIFGG